MCFSCCTWYFLVFCWACGEIVSVDSFFVSITVCFLSCIEMVDLVKSWMIALSLRKVVPPTRSAWSLSTTKALNVTVQPFL